MNKKCASKAQNAKRSPEIQPNTKDAQRKTCYCINTLIISAGRCTLRAAFLANGSHVGVSALPPACISARRCTCCAEFPLDGAHVGQSALVSRTLFCSTVLLFGVISDERLHFRVSGERISDKWYARSRAFLTHACQFFVAGRISA